VERSYVLDRRHDRMLHVISARTGRNLSDVVQQALSELLRHTGVDQADLEALDKVWGAESPSELSGDPPRPATISRRPCSSSSSAPASGSSSTSPLHLFADQAELLVLRHQVRVLERQVKVVRWRQADRLVLAALARWLPGPSWSALLVKPETVLRWHRELVQKEVGDLGTSSSPRSTLDQRRVPGPDPPPGRRKRRLGLSRPQGRAPQARLRSLVQHHV
jgi:hypothetical protein